MKVVKGIFIYTMIILGAILAVGILLLGGMYIFKWPLFGYTFKNVNIQRDTFASIDVKANGIDASSPRIKFVIDSGAYAVRLQPDKEGSYINYYTMSDFIGFVKSTDKLYTPSVETKVLINDEGVLQVNMKVATPKGLVNFDEESNRLTVVVPEMYESLPIYYDVDVKTTSGNIILMNSFDSEGEFNAPLRLKSIVANTESGDITLAGFERQEVKNDEGKFVGYKAAEKVKLNNIHLTTKRGNLDFSNFKEITIEEKFVLTSGKADYIFDRLVATKGIEILGDNILVKANEITCTEGDFVYKSPSGGLQIGTLNCSTYKKVVTAGATSLSAQKYHYEKNGEKLNNVTVFTENANITIGNLMGKARIEDLYGHISIDLLCNQASIRNENGNVTIKKSGVLPLNDDTESIMTATSSMVVYNTYGKIEVNEYYQNGLFANVKGAIKLNSCFSQKTLSNEYYYTKVESKDGNVDFTTSGNPYSINATDKANVTITQNGVYPLNNNTERNQVYYAKTTNGSISATLPTIASKAGNGYILLVEGSLGATPNSTFANLKANEARYYMINNNTSLSDTPVGDGLETALNSYPLIKFVGSQTYVYSAI